MTYEKHEHSTMWMQVPTYLSNETGIYLIIQTTYEAGTISAPFHRCAHRGSQKWTNLSTINLIIHLLVEELELESRHPGARICALNPSDTWQWKWFGEQNYIHWYFKS